MKGSNAVQALIVRQGTPEDLEGLVPLALEVQNLHAELYPDIFQTITDQPEFRAWLADGFAGDNRCLLVAELDRYLCGFAMARMVETPPVPIFVSRRWVEIDTLVVASNARRQGVGQALMDAAEEWARKHGITRMQIVAWEANTEAMTFYERRGYTTMRRALGRDLGMP